MLIGRQKTEYGLLWDADHNLTAEGHGGDGEFIYFLIGLECRSSLSFTV